jgi:hypothetical protein
MRVWWMRLGRHRQRGAAGLAPEGIDVSTGRGERLTRGRRVAGLGEND